MTRTSSFILKITTKIEHMKNIKKLIGIIAFTLFLSMAFAQTPPPPNNGTTGSGGNTPVGGGAPLTDGLIMLISAGILYLCYTEKDHIISLFKSNH